MIFQMFWCLLSRCPVYYYVRFSPLALGFVHLLREPALRFFDCVLCFYFINFTSDFCHFFPSTGFEFGLFLIDFSKLLTCIINSLICFIFFFQALALRAINFPLGTSLRVSSRFYCIVLLLSFDSRKLLFLSWHFI